MGAHLSPGGSSSRTCVYSRSRSRASQEDDINDGHIFLELRETREDTRSGGNATRGESETILQFTSSLYFVEESEGRVVIDIMRLGSTRGPAACCYQTEDSSGKDGERYEAVAGQMVFEDGEFRKSIEVPIIESEQWAATLEFKVILFEPQNCVLGTYLHTCRVKVIDSDTFPSSKYPEIGQGMDGIQKVGGLSLFWEYCKMNFGVNGIASRTVACLVFDQMRNAYIYYKLSAVAYMLNTLFHDIQNKEFSTHQRVNVAYLIGLGYILPMIFLHAWDLVKVQLDIAGHSRCFLQQSIVRKYLNYSEASRNDLANEVTDIQLAVREDAAELAEGYIAVLSILKLVGKLAVLVYFLLIENPHALIYVVVMPSLMAIFACCRNTVLYKSSELPDELSSDLLAFVGDLGKNYTLIANFQQRPKINDEFAKKSSACRSAEVTPSSVRLNNDYFTQWLGPCFVGFFIMTHTSAVLSWRLGRGTFMATLGVFGEVSGDFSEGYAEFMKISRLVGALQGVTEILNRPTDLRSLKQVNRARREATKAARATILQQNSRSPFPTDLIPIECRCMGFGYPTKTVLRNVSLSIPQGSLVAVIGEHGVGKQTFLRLLGHEIFPVEGEIFIPTHLRILPVSQGCYILRMGVLKNLTFGCVTYDHERVMEILSLFEAHKIKDLVQAELSGQTPDDSQLEESRESVDSEEGLPQEQDADVADTSWMKQLHYTEQVKLHMARAFLMDPEVMVLHRPFLHFHESDQTSIMSILQAHINGRGLAMPAETISIRRPRTLFFSAESEEQAKAADHVWLVVADADGGSSTVKTEDGRASKPARYV